MWKLAHQAENSQKRSVSDEKTLKTYLRNEPSRLKWARIITHSVSGLIPAFEGSVKGNTHGYRVLI